MSIPVIGSTDKTTDLSQFGHTIEELVGLIATFGNMRWGTPSDIRDPHLADEAVSLLMEQYKSRQNINDIVRIFASMFQGIEDEAANIYKYFQIQTAQGAQLDEIGLIVDEARNGQSDLEYRLKIFAKIYLNRTGGEIESLISLLKHSTDTPSVRIIELFPAAMRIEIEADNWPNDLYNRVKHAVAGGVAVDIINFTGTNRFRFDTPGQGFEQGQFSSIITL